MNNINYKDIEVTETPHGKDIRKLFISDDIIITHLELRAGEQLKRHITPVNVLFYVLEGTGVIQIGNEQKEVSKDTLIESPANIEHCWYNMSNDVLRILIIKYPKPNKLTTFLE